MAGIFLAQKALKVAAEDIFEEVDVLLPDGKTEKQIAKTGVKETWRQPGEVVPEADSWTPGALDIALNRGDIVYVDQTTIDLRDRVAALEEQVAQLTNRTQQKKGA